MTIKKYILFISLLLLALLVPVFIFSQNDKKDNITTYNVERDKTMRSKKTVQDKISINIGDTILHAHLYQNAATADLKKQLPLELKYVDFNSAEKMGDLAQPLDTKGMPNGAAARGGDIGYWSPDKRIIFYYEDVPKFSGIHIIGHFANRQEAQNFLKTHNSFSATIKVE